MTKNNDIEAIQVPPDPSRTMEGLRDTGYSFEIAIADLIDNSIAAEANKIDIKLQFDLYGQITLSIADDGCGMSKDDLIDAMRYGSRKKTDPRSLGKFGLGLKTASTAFCRILSVTSRANSSDSALEATWNLDYVTNTGKWNLLLTEQVDKASLDHLIQIAGQNSGTVVTWRKVDRLIKKYRNPAGPHAQKAVQKRVDNLKEHLELIFQRYLDLNDDRANDILITLNGMRLEAWDPFCKDESELVANQIVPVEINGEEAAFDLNAYILPRRSEFKSREKGKSAKISADRQGFYIYRENRLIHHATWLRMYQQEPHGSLLRVEFSFEYRLDKAFQLDIKKSQILLDESIWNFLRNQFLPAPRREANTRYRRGISKKIKEKSEDVHDSSNKEISEKQSELNSPKITDIESNIATVDNEQGRFKIKIKTENVEKPGQLHVKPVDSIDDGMLFEATLIDGHKAVNINSKHPFYQKIYIPNYDRNITVQGIDSLLWALCVAELSVTTDKTQNTFIDMRYEVSRILRKLVEDLPDPVLDNDED